MILRGPDHRCILPNGGGGMVYRCDECCQVWEYRDYPNMDYRGWYRLTWLGRKTRRLP